jgi:transposase
MVPWHSREQLEHQTVTLHADGLSRRAIARALGVSRNTVKKILYEHGQARQQPHTVLKPAPRRAPRAKKTDAYQPRAEKLLEKYPNISAQRVFEELQKDGYAGSYTMVKVLVRKLRPKPKATPSLKTPDWGPGKMAESDWSPYDIDFTHTGKQKVQVFSYVLAHSTRKSYQAYLSYDVHALMAGHVEAFERFGGCASCCKYDGQKAVAIGWEGSQPIYNPRFLAFCIHYEMRPWAIRGTPNLRPKVERSFWEHERSFLNGREFRDLDDLRRQLREWLDTIVDHRKRKGTTALERFTEEAPHLVPLPSHPYDTARVVYHMCSIDGFIDYQSNRYAVPYDHVTDILPVRITQHELFVYAADLTCIARHELAPRGAGRTLDPRGFHERRRRKAAIDLDQLRDVYEGMGQGASDFFRALSCGRARKWCYGARRILQLRQRYASKDIDAALGHAARFGALGYESVQRILEARHRPRTLDEYIAAETAERLEALIGYRRTEPRDLTEYDPLPGSNADASDNRGINHPETNDGTTNR